MFTMVDEFYCIYTCKVNRVLCASPPSGADWPNVNIAVEWRASKSKSNLSNINKSHHILELIFLFHRFPTLPLLLWLCARVVRPRVGYAQMTETKVVIRPDHEFGQFNGPIKEHTGREATKMN